MYTLPRWQVQLLIRELPALDALENTATIEAVLAPYLKDHDRRALLRRLDRRMRSLRAPEPAPELPTDHDPEQAAAWFAAQGIKVRHA